MLCPLLTNEAPLKNRKEIKMSPDKAPTAPEQPVPEPEVPYYTSRELAALLGISMNTLAIMRRTGDTPQYTVIGYRTLRYPKKEFRRYLKKRTREDRMRTSTSATQNYDLQH